jgi:hypothetical protein
MPPFKGQPQNPGQAYKPRNEQKVPNTLAPSNVVDETPWCFQCRDAHWEHECPMNNGDPDQVNIMNYVFTEEPQVCLNITLEQHEEGIKEASRRARMEVINNLDKSQGRS